MFERRFILTKIRENLRENELIRRGIDREGYKYYLTA